MVKHNPKYVDAQRFSDNAAQLLIERGQIAEMFDSLDYSITQNREGDGYIGLCPVCEDSNCLIGLNGKAHRIWWRCLSKSCPSNADGFKTPKNLLSLAKFLVGSQGAAFAAIADFLGYEGRSFDITNGKFSPQRREAAGYVWLVPDESLKTTFDEAGIEAVVHAGGVPPRRTNVYSLLHDKSVPASGGRFDPLDWDFLSPAEIRKKCLAIMNRAGLEA